MCEATVWTRESDNCKVLAEPYINSAQFTKFNSNSGRETADDVCRALSHFSYTHTNGEILLCDL